VILIVMGPSGCGKTAVGRGVAARLGCAFVDADDLHTAVARAKMQRGEPLREADRGPWLDRVRAGAERAAKEHATGRAVVACSSLRQVHRDRLRAADSPVRFVALIVGEDELRRRVAERSARGDHFMPESLVADQVRTFELPGADELDVIVIPGEEAVEKVIDHIVKLV